MRRDLIPRLRCPCCAAAPLIAHALDDDQGPLLGEGALSCDGCGRWFPVCDHLLELVPDALADLSSRRAFWERHRPALTALGLGEPEPAASTGGDGFEVQAGQRRYFDGLAEGGGESHYEQFMGTPFWRAQDARLYSRWLPQIEPGSLVLDVGCGDGRTTFALAERSTSVLAFDLSPKQVRRAVDRARRDGLLGQFSFFVGDASAFPLVDCSVECVLMDGVLHHLPEPAESVRETGRVLREGGRYFGKENNKTPLRPIFDWLQRFRPLWVEEAGPEQLISTAAITAWARAAGIRLAVAPAVYLPPHAFGRFTERGARRVLEATDRLLGRVPVVRRWGGLLVIEGVRVAAAQTGDGAPS